MNMNIASPIFHTTLRGQGEFRDDFLLGSYTPHDMGCLDAPEFIVAGACHRFSLEGMKFHPFPAQILTVRGKQ